LPGLIALAALAIVPMFYQVAISLTDLNTASLKDGLNGGVWRAVWQGLTLQEPMKPVDIFSTAPVTNKTVHFAGPSLFGWLFTGLGADVLVFNVLFAGLAVTFQTGVGVGAALLLDRPGVRLKNFWRSILILPWAIPEFVGALIWLRIFAPRYGWLSESLPKGIPNPSILDDKNFAMFAVVVAATWAGFPLIMLAASAGLKLIPREALDAAALDGAGAWAKFRYVLWPLLWPLLLPAVLIRAILAFNQFYLLLVMRLDYPLMTFAQLSYMSIQFFGGQYAVSAAINIFTLIILVALIVWFNRWSKASEGVTYA
jgi:ABC-type sugar transport system permease subunit